MRLISWTHQSGSEQVSLLTSPSHHSAVSQNHRVIFNFVHGSAGLFAPLCQNRAVSLTPLSQSSAVPLTTPSQQFSIVTGEFEGAHPFTAYPLPTSPPVSFPERNTDMRFLLPIYYISQPDEASVSKNSFKSFVSNLLEYSNLAVLNVLLGPLSCLNNLQLTVLRKKKESLKKESRALWKIILLWGALRYRIELGQSRGMILDSTIHHGNLTLIQQASQ